TAAQRDEHALAALLLRRLRNGLARSGAIGGARLVRGGAGMVRGCAVLRGGDEMVRGCTGLLRDGAMVGATARLGGRGGVVAPMRARWIQGGHRSPLIQTSGASRSPVARETKDKNVSAPPPDRGAVSALGVGASPAGEERRVLSSSSIGPTIEDAGRSPSPR